MNPLIITGLITIGTAIGVEIIDYVNDVIDGKKAKRKKGKK